MSGIAPIRRQYCEIKRQYPDVLLFFRLGDFYETFEDDARTAAEVLSLTLTSRDVGRGVQIPMTGIIYHAIDNAIAQLTAAGHKVALCDINS